MNFELSELVNFRNLNFCKLMNFGKFLESFGLLSFHSYFSDSSTASAGGGGGGDVGKRVKDQVLASVALKNGKPGKNEVRGAAAKLQQQTFFLYMTQLIKISLS